MRAGVRSSVAFSLALVASGTLCLAQMDFAAIFQGVPKLWRFRTALLYLSSFVSLGGAVALLRDAGRAGSPSRAPRQTTIAPAGARVLAVYLFCWLLAIKVPVLVRAPTAADSWESCGESVVVLAAAWTLYARLATDWDKRTVGAIVGDRGLMLARRIFGYALVTFGVAHFAFAPETASLVPRWMPMPVELVYLTGGTYIAGGLAVLIRIHARVAASLAALQMGLFTVLVWVPTVVAETRTAYPWSELVLSYALSASAWVIAEGYPCHGRTSG